MTLPFFLVLCRVCGAFLNYLLSACIVTGLEVYSFHSFCGLFYSISLCFTLSFVSQAVIDRLAKACK